LSDTGTTLPLPEAIQFRIVPDSFEGDDLMHIAGINWAAVLVAAAVFLAIGYVIHLRLVDLKAWDAAKHTDQSKLSKARMASGMILPLATAIGLAVLFSWGDVGGVWNGIKWAWSLPWLRGFRSFGTTGSTGLCRSGSFGSTAPTN
jgi:hypothetical protein